MIDEPRDEVEAAREALPGETAAAEEAEQVPGDRVAEEVVTPDEDVVLAVKNELEMARDTGDTVTIPSLVEATGYEAAELTNAIDYMREQGDAREETPGEFTMADAEGEGDDAYDAQIAPAEPDGAPEPEGPEDEEPEDDGDEDADEPPAAAEAARPALGKGRGRAVIVVDATFPLSDGIDDADIRLAADVIASTLRSALGTDRPGTISGASATTQVVSVEAYDQPRKVFP